MNEDWDWLSDMAGLALAVILIVIGTAVGGLLYWWLT
jgi:hypothetical protein